MGSTQNAEHYLRDFIKNTHDPGLRRVFSSAYICEKPEKIHRRMLELEYLWRNQYPNENVLHMNGTDFAASVLQAVINDNLQELKGAYYSADLLIIEEVDAISGKTCAMEVAYIIIDYLLEHDRCLIFSSDYLPREIPALEDRNRAQFEGCVIYNLRDR